MSPYREDPPPPHPVALRLVDVASVAWAWLPLLGILAIVAALALGLRAGCAAEAERDACRAECMATHRSASYTRVAGRCFCTPTGGPDDPEWLEVTP